MLQKLKLRSGCHVVAVLGLTLAVGTGGASAANTVGSADIIDESIVSADLKNYGVKRADIGLNSINSARIEDNTLVGADINESLLGEVPSADVADTLDGRDSSGFLQINPAASQDPPSTNLGTPALWARPATNFGGTYRADFKFMNDGGLLLSAHDANFDDAPIPASGCGIRMMWYPGKAAFRAGTPGHCPGGASTLWDDASTGLYSWAGGHATRASGASALAFGNSNTASGEASVALGYGTLSSGAASFSAGLDSKAEGFRSTAIGSNSRATSDGSVAIGMLNGAFGANSMALGYRAVTAPCPDPCLVANVDPATGFEGAFVWGDRSTSAHIRATANNQWSARAAGGFRLFTHANLTTGCSLPAGSGVFACTSDRNAKRDIAPVDGASVLKRLASLPITTWRYKTEAGAVRHMGPMAQDFHRAFGLGSDDKQIGSIDEAGVSMAAIKALYERSQRQSREIAALRKQVAALASGKR